MIVYSYRNKQIARITFLTIRFYTVMKMNRNANKERRFNFKFFYIQTMLFLWLNKYSSL